MRKTIILSIFICLGIFLFGSNCLAASSITLNEAPAINIYPSEFDKLVLDFELTVDQPDSLQALTIKNEGLARGGYEITKAVLWPFSLATAERVIIPNCSIKRCCTKRIFAIIIN